MIRRKIDLFGITNEEVTELGAAQTNYVYDKCHSVLKDFKTGISMLDHFLRNNIPEQRKIIIYADNSAAQNKNHMIAYLAYLVKIVKRYSEIELYYMEHIFLKGSKIPKISIPAFCSSKRFQNQRKSLENF